MKIKLAVEYAGKNFHGWQVQAGEAALVTVQGELERAISIFLNSEQIKTSRIAGLQSEQDLRVIVTGSGRTDAGVHAKGQVASFAWPPGLEFDKQRFIAAINGITCKDVGLLSAEPVDDAFDARRTQHEKQYAYRLLLVPAKHGFDCRAWRLPDDNLDIRLMVEAARLFVGQHDFCSFRASDCSAPTTVRTLSCSELTRLSASELIYIVRGTGFLKQMIRIIVSSIVQIGRGKLSINTVKEMLGGKKHATAPAPPGGLVLEWVRYFD